MMSKQSVAGMTLSLMLGVVSSPNVVSGQLPSASTATLATANNYTALARGFTAIATNPAGLGMSDNPGFSLTFLPIQARAGLNAIKVSEINEVAGALIPTTTKERWLETVTTEGALTARAGFAVTEFAMTAGRVGFQLSTVGEMSASLSPDAFELILFGNAGRTGTARDMTLAGTGGDAWAASTAAVAFAIPLSGGGDGNLAFGVTLKYTVGHAVIAARDDGGVITASPIGIDLALPIIAPDSFSVNNGSGVGLDLGLAWEGEAWTFSAAVQNVINTFEWNLDAFAFRPGTVFADQDSISTNFDPVPIASAPSALRTEILEQGFEPVLNLAVAFRTSDRFALTADYRYDSGETLVIGEGSHIGVGAEVRLLPFLPLRGGVSRIEGGAVHLAGGFALELGPLHFSAAYLVEKKSAGEYRAATVAMSFAHN